MEELIAGLFWKKIDPQKYPDGLVMAANFDQGSIYFNERLVGYLYPHLFSEHIGVVDDLAPYEMNIEIPRITHYIEL